MTYVSSQPFVDNFLFGLTLVSWVRHKYDMAKKCGVISWLRKALTSHQPWDDALVAMIRAATKRVAFSRQFQKSVDVTCPFSMLRVQVVDGTSKGSSASRTLAPVKVSQVDPSCFSLAALPRTKPWICRTQPWRFASQQGHRRMV